jgi:hypothetical protein
MEELRAGYADAFRRDSRAEYRCRSSAPRLRKSNRAYPAQALGLASGPPLMAAILFEFRSVAGDALAIGIPGNRGGHGQRPCDPQEKGER